MTTDKKTSDSSDLLTSSGILARNTLINLLGFSIPLIVALFAVPRIITGLGIERFGVLTLAWLVIGYFSLFDLGLGRVLTLLVSQRLGTDSNDQIPSLVWTSLLLMLVLGIFGSVLTISLSPWLVLHVLKIPSELQPETLRAFTQLGLCVPFVINTAGLRGVLAAHQKFGVINAVDTSSGLFTFIAPVATLFYSSDLGVIIFILVVGRVAVWAAYMALVNSTMPELVHNPRLKLDVVPEMLRWGGWMTVSSIVGPVMAYFDRFLIASLVSVTAVAYYVTPSEVAGRLGFIPQALVRVLFPAFSRSYSNDRERAASLCAEGAKYVLLCLFPIVMLGVTLAPFLLEIWLGPTFSANAAKVLQVFLIGMLVNGPAQVAFTLIQAAERSDLTAKVHFIELPIFLLALWCATNKYGIEGAAYVCLVRITIDAIVLFGIARALLNRHWHGRRLIVIAVTAIPALILGTLPLSVYFKVILLLLTIPGFLAGTWRFALSSNERHTAKDWIRRILWRRPANVS